MLAVVVYELEIEKSNSAASVQKETTVEGLDLKCEQIQCASNKHWLGSNDRKFTNV